MNSVHCSKCVCVCVCVSTAPSVCVCVSTAPSVCVCVCPLLQVCVCVCPLLQVCVCPLLQVCVCVCVHCSKCVCVCMCPLLQVCVCVCVCVSTAPSVCALEWVKCRELNFTTGYTPYNYVCKKKNSISDYGKMLTYRENIGKPMYRSISNLNSTVFCPIHTKISLLNLFFFKIYL